MFLNKLGHIKSQALLASLIIMLIVSPVIEITGGTGIWSSLFWALILVACVANAGSKASSKVLIASLALAWLITKVLPISGLLSPALAAIALILTIKIILSSIFKAHHVDKEILSSALSVYLLIGMAWTAFYTALYHISPDAFILPNEPVFLLL